MQKPNDAEDTGWVKIHRRLLKNPRYRDPEWVSVWLYLLLNVTHAPQRKLFNGKVVELQPGQLITGRHVIAAATNVHRSKVERILNMLKIEQQIEQQPGNKGSIITVLNWASYQNSDNKSSSSRAAAEQQPSTLQEGKEEQELKNTQGELAAAWSDPLAIPANLNTQRFTNDWQRWMTFRRGLGKKPKDWATLFSEQLKWLAGFGEPTACLIIEQSIRNGWQGLFEPKDQGRTARREIKPEPGDF